MTKTVFATRLEDALAGAVYATDLWVGTLISDVIEAKMNALLKSVNNGDAKDVQERLLSYLIDATDEAIDQYED